MDRKVAIILFDEEELTKTLIENYIKESSFPYEVFKYDSFDKHLIPDDKNKKIIIVNVNKTNTILLRQISELSVNKNNLFVLISYDKSTDLQVKSLRCGAKDFLLKPLIQSDFIYSLNKIYKNYVLNPEKNKNAKIYSVLSIGEQTGKTFFTFNIAKEIADLSGEKVLYIDFNNNLKDIYSILRWNCIYNTSSVINNINNENAESIFSALPQYKSSPLYIAGNGVFRKSDMLVQTEKIADFFNIAKKYFGFIFVDNAAIEDSSVREVINSSDIIYFITEPSMLMADKVSVCLKNNLLNRSVRIILNKYNPKKDEKLANEIEKKIGLQIFFKLPKNVVATSSSLSGGVTLREMSPDLDLVKEYMKLANYMMNRDR